MNAVKMPGHDEDEPERDMDAGRIPVDPDRAEVKAHLLELARGEPARHIGARRVERDVAEVEQAGVADDDVQADGHHREDENDHHRAELREEVSDHGEPDGRLSTTDG